MWAWSDGNFASGWGIGMGIFCMIMMVMIISSVFMMVLRRRGCFAMGCMPTGQHGDSAQAILRERFARGEVSNDFEHIRKDLGA